MTVTNDAADAFGLSVMEDGFLSAARAGNLARVKEVLAANPAAMTQRCKTLGFTALLHAASAGKTPIVEFLLNAGDVIETKSNKGVSPLMAAAVLGHRDTVRLLLERGADTTVRTADGAESVFDVIARKGRDKSFLQDIPRWQAEIERAQVAKEAEAFGIGLSENISPLKPLAFRPVSPATLKASGWGIRKSPSIAGRALLKHLRGK